MLRPTGILPFILGTGWDPTIPMLTRSNSF